MNVARCVVLAVAGAASSGAVSQEFPSQTRDDHFTCTVIRPSGERGAVVPETWPGGIVPYEFDGGVSATNQSRVRSAMNMLEASAGVTFIPRTNESNRLMIGEYGGNWSQVGMSGGQQSLSIYNWTQPLIICHELIHALGRHHQQCRMDRDDYVQVNWGNIDDDYEYNYYIANSDEVGPYDFESVMHYSQWGFSIGGPTMTCQPGYEQWQNVMGQRDYLSDGDTATLQHMYPDGESDASIMYVQVSPEQIEAGDLLHVVSVIKNIGEQAAFDAVGSVYLSADARESGVQSVKPVLGLATHLVGLFQVGFDGLGAVLQGFLQGISGQEGQDRQEQEEVYALEDDGIPRNHRGVIRGHGSGREQSEKEEGEHTGHGLFS